jgi:hypothetical protein
VRAEFTGKATYDIVTGRIILPTAADSFRLRMQRGAARDSIVLARGVDHASYAVLSSEASGQWTESSPDMSSIVDEIEQHTGFGAPMRAPTILRARGYPGLIAEAERMQIDHAVGRYLTEALTRQAPTAAELGRVLDVAVRRVSNEFQLVALLTAAAGHRALADRSLQASYLHAVDALSTTAGRRSAMAALVRHYPGARD